MSMPRVFVVQNQKKKDEHGVLVSKFDLAPAREFGELVEVVRSGYKPFGRGGSSVAREAGEKLARHGFSAADYVLCIGNPVIIGIVTAQAARLTNGKVRFLQWSGTREKYETMEVDVYS